MDIPIEQLRALSAIIETGTFDAAARRLGVTPSAVSQRVRALETTTGRVLLLRSKPVRPTEAGETVLRLARQVESAYDEAERRLTTSSRRPRVPLVVNADSLATWALAPLAEVAEEIELEILREDEAHSAELLRDGSAMAVVTSDPSVVPGCEVQPLGRMRYRPCASPGFVARYFPDGAGPTAYATAPVVIYDRKDALQHSYLRRRARRELDPPTTAVPASSEFLRAIELGMGWGLLPDLQSAASVAAGRIVAFDAQRHVDVPLFWQQWRLPSASLSRVGDALRRAADAALR